MYLTFRDAEIGEEINIYEILSKSFNFYVDYYTKKAYQETVINSNKIKYNIIEKNKSVKVVLKDLKIIATVTITPKNDSLYISSMAVLPKYQKLGIGLFVLNQICLFAESKGYDKLLLETYEPLKPALKLYEKYGFKRNGKKRDFFGIEIFEMIKEL